MTAVDHPDFFEPQVAGANQIVASTTLTIAAGANGTAGAYDVTAFQQVLIEITNTGNLQSRYRHHWYTTAAGGLTTGFNQTYFSNGGGTTLLALGTQGAGLDVNIFNDGVSQNTWGVAIFGFPDQRDLSQLVVPTQLVYVSQSIAVNTSQVGTFSQQVPGKAVVGVNSDHPGVAAIVENWSGAAWNRCAFVSASATSLGNTQTVLLPWSDCRLEVFNFGGGTAVVQGSVTGPE